MVVVRAGRAERQVVEVRVDPRDGGQVALRRPLEEAAVAEDVAAVEERGHVLEREADLGVEQPDRRHVVVRVPPPLVVLQVAHERRDVVRPARLDVVAQAVRGAGGGVAAVRHGRARYGAEPVVADAELAREEVVDGQMRGRVVRHHDAGVGAAALAGLHEVRDEAAGVARELLVHAPARVARVLRLGHRRPRRRVDGERLAAIVVLHRERRPLDVGASLLDRQEAEHVVERPVLHHQDDDVVDLAEVLVGLGHACASRLDCAAVRIRRGAMAPPFFRPSAATLPGGAGAVNRAQETVSLTSIPACLCPGMEQ